MNVRIIPGPQLTDELTEDRGVLLSSGDVEMIHQRQTDIITK